MPLLKLLNVYAVKRCLNPKLVIGEKALLWLDELCLNILLTAGEIVIEQNRKRKIILPQDIKFSLLKNTIDLFNNSGIKIIVRDNRKEPKKLLDFLGICQTKSHLCYTLNESNKPVKPEERLRELKEFFRQDPDIDEEEMERCWRCKEPYPLSDFVRLNPNLCGYCYVKIKQSKKEK